MVNYEPICLEKTNSQIQKAREDYLKQQKQPLSMNEDYRSLFHQIAASGSSEAKSWAYALQNREIELLCTYLFEEANEADALCLVMTICEKMNTALVKYLYQKVQDYFDDKRLFSVYGYLRANENFATAFFSLYGIRPDGIFGSLQQGNGIQYINSRAGKTGNSTKVSYLEGLSSLGVVLDTRLFLECTKFYIMVCDASEYRRMGADNLLQFAGKLEKDLKIRLLHNMLKCMDSYQLRMFVPLLDIFRPITGKLNSESFYDAMRGLTSEQIEKYKLWLNQYQIWFVLGTSERADFWMSYAGTCITSLHEPSHALLLTFKEFTVIEFQKEGYAAYFYDNLYFEEKVKEGLALSTSEEELEAWLYQKTQWGAQGDHIGHWRKAHKNNWKLDMKEYMMHRSIKA